MMYVKEFWEEHFLEILEKGVTLLGIANFLKITYMFMYM